jgi:hypothetical protein
MTHFKSASLYLRRGRGFLRIAKLGVPSVDLAMVGPLSCISQRVRAVLWLCAVSLCGQPMVSTVICQNNLMFMTNFDK